MLIQISSGRTTDMLIFFDVRLFHLFWRVFLNLEILVWIINGRYLRPSRNLFTLWSVIAVNKEFRILAVICFFVQNLTKNMWRILIGIMLTLWIKFLGQLKSAKNLLLLISWNSYILHFILSPSISFFVSFTCKITIHDLEPFFYLANQSNTKLDN